MRDYDNLWNKVKRLNKYERDLLLMKIFHEFKSREIFGVTYPTETFFEETIGKEVEKEKIAQ